MEAPITMAEITKTRVRARTTQHCFGTGGSCHIDTESVVVRLADPSAKLPCVGCGRPTTTARSINAFVLEQLTTQH